MLLCYRPLPLTFRCSALLCISTMTPYRKCAGRFDVWLEANDDRFCSCNCLSFPLSCVSDKSLKHDHLTERGRQKAEFILCLQWCSRKFLFAGTLLLFASPLLFLSPPILHFPSFPPLPPFPPSCFVYRWCWLRVETVEINCIGWDLKTLCHVTLVVHLG